MLFAATFLTVAIWETVSRQRAFNCPVERRWTNHGVLLIISTMVGLLVFRVSAVALAGMAASSRFGILNKPGLPLSLRWACAIVVLDLARYLTHRSFHSVRSLANS